jgi:hypothetical protein
MGLGKTLQTIAFIAHLKFDLRVSREQAGGLRRKLTHPPLPGIPLTPSRITLALHPLTLLSPFTFTPLLQRGPLTPHPLLTSSPLQAPTPLPTPSLPTSVPCPLPSFLARRCSARHLPPLRSRHLGLGAPPLVPYPARSQATHQRPGRARPAARARGAGQRRIRCGGDHVRNGKGAGPALRSRGEFCFLVVSFSPPSC